MSKRSAKQSVKVLQMIVIAILMNLRSQMTRMCLWLSMKFIKLSRKPEFTTT